MLPFKETTISDFVKITGYDIYSLIDYYVAFIEVDSRKIIDYYAGNFRVADSVAFSKLDILLTEAKKVEEIFYLNRESFINIADWNLLDKIEDIIKSLEIIKKSSKFLRSPITNLNYNEGIQSEYGLKQNETLETISRLTLQNSDFDNNWVDLAVKNDLTEEEYSNKGGVLLKIVFDKTYPINYLESVVDNLEGEKMYGKDLDRTITFVDDDLKVLTYKETIQQACDILCNLNKGDVPEFPDDGISSSIIVGSNLKAIAFPVIFRQYYSLFSKDDTFSSFSITNVGFYQDAVFIEAEIRTVYGDLLLNKTIYFNK